MIMMKLQILNAIKWYDFSLEYCLEDVPNIKIEISIYRCEI